jgi:hypothetical protein
MALAELAKFYNSFEAGAARSRLDADGIESFLFDMNMSWEGISGIIPIRLMVDEDDLARARHILAEDLGG